MPQRKAQPTPQTRSKIDRRHEIVRRHLHGDTAQAIADDLGVTWRTVQRHIDEWRKDNTALPDQIRQRFEQTDALLERALWKGDHRLIRSLGQLWVRAARLLKEEPPPPPDENMARDVADYRAAVAQVEAEEADKEAQADG